MTITATRTSWKNLPSPARREHFNLSLPITGDQVEQLKRGHIPRDMDDKWFVFFEDGWLHFNRSWTGAGIFAVKLDPGGTLAECWVTRDGEHYKSPGIEQERELLGQLVAARLKG